MTVGKIERLPLRDVWKHEEYDFTTRLEEIVDVLNDIVDLEITWSGSGSTIDVPPAYGSPSRPGAGRILSRSGPMSRKR